MDEKNLILTLKRPVKFEGKEYKTIDLSALDDLTGEDYERIGAIYNRRVGIPAAIKEYDYTYLIVMAMEATGLPEELFKALNIKDANALERRVRNFLFV